MGEGSTRGTTFLVLGLVLLLAGSAAAEYSPVSMSLGGTGVVDTGLSALHYNPAAVHSGNQGRYSLELGAAAGIGNNVFALMGDLDDLVEALDDGDLDAVMEMFGRDGVTLYATGLAGGRLRVDADPYFEGSVAGFLGVGMEGQGHVPPGIFDALSDILEVVDLEDNDGNDDEGGPFEDLEGMTIDLEGAGLAAGAFTDGGIGLSYDLTDQAAGELAANLGDGVEVDALIIGGNLRVLRGAILRAEGFGSTEFREERFEIDVDNGGNENNGEELEIVLPRGDARFLLEYIEDTSAGGVALDLGIYGEFNEKYQMGVGVQNLFGTLTARQGRFVEVLFDMDVDLESIEDEDLDDEELEEAIKEAFEEAAEGMFDEGDLDEAFSYRLPLVLRAGGGYEVMEDVNILAATSWARHEIGPDELRFSVGAETTTLPYTSLRGGLNYSTTRGNVAMSAGAGLDLDFMTADIAFSDLGALFGRAQNFTSAMCVGFEF